MPSTHKSRTNQLQHQLEVLNDAMQSGTFASVAHMLNGLKPEDVAHLLESSPPRMRHIIWQLVEPENQGKIVQYLSEDVQGQILEQMDVQEVVAATEGLESDDVADMLQQLPNRIIQEVLLSMGQQDRKRVEEVISYDEDSAGGLMSTDLITVRASVTLDVVLRFIRRHEELPPATDSIFIVNRKDQFVGVLPLSRLLVSDPNTTVREIMTTDIETITVDMNAADVALLFERYDWVSAAVVAESGKLLGRITIDDVVDVIREDAEHNMLGMAGLSDDEDTFSPVSKTFPRRAVWLGVNLLTAIMASLVIKLFEGTIEKVVALAVLMPIVASMGGVAGSQTLTVVIRGIALRQIGKNNFGWLLNREVVVGFLNGAVWAVVVAAAAALLYGDMALALIIASAMILNLVMAGLVGTLLPIGLKRMNIDPALAGSVILTTFTDIAGFFAFLGLATWFYQ
ncbi:Magnesium transporter MgtE [BD1-7 clade bacterium]|uniref:Magnesium transporter MgtE n=1 Tax=BD1-7 clade bacterium TaxID=2029982 RepID=A0A5S9MT93_9GAMM|nr:Magnesium transporter MgtE [BD1-7 clade bacterium]CAA0084803.1 Magnesium transporter MgtE [BD1-7 clade bacterium]